MPPPPPPPPPQVSAISNLINVCLDPLLIFTAGMGIAGAGAATAASQLFSAAAYLTLLLRMRIWGLKPLIGSSPLHLRMTHALTRVPGPRRRHRPQDGHAQLDLPAAVARLAAG